MSKEPTAREMGIYFALASIGMEMVLPAILGIYLDQWFETIPWITCILAVVGFAAGLVHLTAILKIQEKDDSSGKKS